jgi:hypothetical protein
VFNFFLEARVWVFERLFEAVTASIIFPAMVGAANAALFDKSIVKRNAAMGAMLADQTVGAA